ncbi:hypothetical protein ACJIZ3_016373 [Penstemon smallii]|uniref:Uncharacterized protein n=1 Tax=Penstemon smallii TaxID=265156 RepID=A0ABD3RQ77_9LAMI
MASVSPSALSLCISAPPHSSKNFPRKISTSLSPSNSSASASHESSSSATKRSDKFNVSAKAPFVEPAHSSDTAPFNYVLPNPKGNSNPVVRFVQFTESTIERVIFDFRFLALLAVGGSLAGSLLCFLNGCVYIFDAYRVYWTSCVKGIHTGKMVLLLVEAIDVYLAGTVMLIFGMGLYGLFISNVPSDIPSADDRALKGSSLFGMFALKVSILSTFDRLSSLIN